MKRIGILFCAGLIGPAAAAPPAANWDRATPVEIVLTNFAFTPKELHLRQGQAYRLHFVNNGSGGHNFTAPDFFARAQVDPDDAGAIVGGRVELHKHESRDIRLIPAAGTYKARCTHFMHGSFGMKGSIIVD